MTPEPKKKSRFVLHDGEGISHDPDRPLTDKDEREAAEIWEEMTRE